MDIYTGCYKGLNCYYLENEMLKLIVMPELGAKIGSLFYKPQNFEVFFQPADGTYSLPKYGADFATYDTSGADEMFPTIDCCVYPYPGYLGKQLPDHGELWSLPWVVTEADGLFTTEVKGVAFPYLFKRSIMLNATTVHMEYKVYNTGDQPLYGLWAFHGLAAADELTKIILPEVKNVITVHNSQLLGPIGSAHTFPVTVDKTGNERRLDSIAVKSAEKTEKIYAEGKIMQGQAGLILNKGQLLYKLLFPAHQVPYLGIWLNEGGFKGEYNCALEPSTGYYDSLTVAQKKQSLEPLQPGNIMEWYLDIELTPCCRANHDGVVDKK